MSSRRRTKGSGKGRSSWTFFLGKYIYKVLKQIHPELSISKLAMQVNNDFVWHMGRQLLSKAEEMSIHEESQTIQARHIKAAVALIVPGELAKYSWVEGWKAVCKYKASTEPRWWSKPAKSDSNRERTKRKSNTDRAGLVFPVGRFETWVRKETGGLSRVSKLTAVYLAGALEYLVAELLELSGNAAKDNCRRRINPRHIMIAIRNDDELELITRGVIIPESGVYPYIHHALLPPPKKPRKTAPEKQSEIDESEGDQSGISAANSSSLAGTVDASKNEQVPSNMDGSIESNDEESKEVSVNISQISSVSPSQPSKSEKKKRTSSLISVNESESSVMLIDLEPDSKQEESPKKGSSEEDSITNPWTQNIWKFEDDELSSSIASNFDRDRVNLDSDDDGGSSAASSPSAKIN